MPNRYIRNTIIQAKLETTYGVDPGSWAASDAILLAAPPSHRIIRDTVDRNLIRPFFGGSEQLVGSRVAEITFDVELAASGTAGTAPPWGRLLRACAMAETITAATMVEYTPVTTAQESLTIRYAIDGVLYVSRGARGDVSVLMGAYDRPVLRFRFMGFDTAATANSPSGTFASWQRPILVTDANAGDIRFGCTYTGATGALSGGTAYPSRGLTLALGNTVSPLKLLSAEAVEVTARAATGSLQVALTASQEVTWRTEVNTNVLTSLGFSLGSVAGSRLTVFAPAVQRVDPQIEDYEGVHLVASELRLLPSAGNDEFRIVSR